MLFRKPTECPMRERIEPPLHDAKTSAHLRRLAVLKRIERSAPRDDGPPDLPTLERRADQLRAELGQVEAQIDELLGHEP